MLNTFHSILILNQNNLKPLIVKTDRQLFNYDLAIIVSHPSNYFNNALQNLALNCLIWSQFGPHLGAAWFTLDHKINSHTSQLPPIVLFRKEAE